MYVSIIGTGYVGLVSGVCLAEKGHQVICVDTDQAKVKQINQGVSPIYEKGLDDLLKKNIGNNITASTDLYKAIQKSTISLIAVGTPFDGGKIDLFFIETAAKEIGKALRRKDDYHVVVVKSTVVPGTTDGIVRTTLEEHSGKQAGKHFGLGMNPEFLREGEAVDDLMNPDRIVMGGIDDQSIKYQEELYQFFEGTDKIRTSCKTAEMIKYTANALLATMISFSNEIGNLCSALGNVDVIDVMKGVHLDKRLSPILSNGQRIVPGFTTYLEAGCGFGGSCFPKDVKAIVSHGQKVGQPMSLLNATIDVNRKQPEKILHILRKNFSTLKGIKIAVLGLAFKPNTDDMRESPAIPVIRELKKEGALIYAYDPTADKEAVRLFGHNQIFYHDHLESAVDDVDAIVLLTRWDAFKKLPQLLHGRKFQPLVVDGRRMLDKSSVKRYQGIGYQEIIQ